MILFVSAIREELGELPGRPLGLGAVAAAASMAELLAREDPDSVVMLGTGGSYPGGPPIGSVVVAARVGLSPGVAAMGLGYVPKPPEPLICNPDLVSRIQAPAVSVLTVHAITTDPILAGRLADDWQVEHLEAYGAALACSRTGIPFTAVLGIASEVGPEAHTHWLLHRADAQTRARDAVISLLAQVPA